jgi:hypothetical protein
VEPTAGLHLQVADIVVSTDGPGCLWGFTLVTVVGLALARVLRRGRFVPIAAEHEWSIARARPTLGATAVSAIGVQKMPGTWLQVRAGAPAIAAYA